MVYKIQNGGLLMCAVASLQLECLINHPLGTGRIINMEVVLIYMDLQYIYKMSTLFIRSVPSGNLPKPLLSVKRFGLCTQLSHLWT